MAGRACSRHPDLPPCLRHAPTIVDLATSGDVSCGVSQIGLPDYGPRLKAAGEAVRDARKAWELRVRQLHELVVEAVDEGMTQRKAAEYAGVSQAHVNRILTESQPDAVLPR